MLWLGKQVVVKRIRAAVLQNQVQLRLRFNDIQQFGDSGMRQLSEYVDLPFQIFDLVGLIQPLLLVYLDCYFFIGALIHAHLHDSIGSLAQFSIDLVVVLLFL